MIENFGDGRDGNLTVNSGTFNVNSDASGTRSYADGIAYKVTTNPITEYVYLSDTPHGISAGDKVIIINLQGAPSDYDDVGNWELFDIIESQSTYVRIDGIPSKSYDGSSWADQNVVLQRVPQYENVVVSGTGEITASAWDRLSTTPAGSAGYYTGMVAMVVSDTLEVRGGSINVANKGYYGAPEGTDGGKQYGWPGESTGKPNTSRASNGNYVPEGGGAAAYYGGSGGAGGGHGTDGENGNPNNDVSDRTFYGAPAFGDTALYRMNYGGGGGGAGEDTDGRYGVGGGYGGGIIYIQAHTINSFGSITADGQKGADGVYIYDFNSGGGGGGGAGGTVYIKTVALNGTSSTISAIGGEGGSRAAAASKSKDGGAGGHGLTRIDYAIVNGHDYPYSTEINSLFDPDPYTSLLLYGFYAFSGYTSFLYDVPASGVRVLAYRRDTGEHISTTTSSEDGYFQVFTTYSGEHFVVALDNDNTPSYNDVIVGKVTPIYYTT